MGHVPNLKGPSAPSVRMQLVALMKDERHEEALALLYRARADEPDNVELRQSIDHLKGYLVGVYAARLGGLDGIAPAVPRNAPRSADTLMLSRYVDGCSSFGDIAEISPLGQLRTLQLLVSIYTPDKVGSPPLSPRSAPVTSRRLESGEHSTSRAHRANNDDDEQTPQTARSPSSRGLAPAAFSDPESEEALRYKEVFSRGTAAFVQRRYQEAVEAFGICVEIKEKDPAASVMLRRSLQGLKLQVP